MSGAPRPESLNRLTDIVVDKVAPRLGTSGTGLADDLVGRLDQSLGLPIEISAQQPNSSALNVGPSQYVMANGSRATVLDESSPLQITAGVIDFHLGTITAGSNGSFTLPFLVPSNNFIKAMVQLKRDAAAINVSFGSPGISLSAASNPPLLQGYLPICLVELHSSAGGTGVFDAITPASLVFLLGGLASGRGPLLETQTVTAANQSLFTLSTITIPLNRAKLWVWENGIRLFGDAYSVPTDNTVSLVQAAPQNAVMTFEVRN